MLQWKPRNPRIGSFGHGIANINQLDFQPKRNTWTLQDSAVLYGLKNWGDDYFSINEQGNIAVNPQGKQGASLDLMDLVKELEGRNLKLPLLIRFDDILEDRLRQLHQAFEKASIYAASLLDNKAA